ncbi:ricin-type beta-trefoil lectin domain protein [Streptomyces sp. NPDC052236]|uniref:ricin-type beta-trefoil lectin domain protein n=1 Tax=Streptomyces sp. NPDC052236 TaxID=3365686 RepID=UPI0037D7408D
MPDRPPTDESAESAREAVRLAAARAALARASAAHQSDISRSSGGTAERRRGKTTWSPFEKPSAPPAAAPANDTGPAVGEKSPKRRRLWAVAALCAVALLAGAGVVISGAGNKDADTSEYAGEADKVRPEEVAPSATDSASPAPSVSADGDLTSSTSSPAATPTGSTAASGDKAGKNKKPAGGPATGTGTGTSSASPKAPSGQRLAVEAGGKCLSGGSGGASAQLTVQPCAASTGQSWVATGGTLRIGAMCMSVEGGKTADRTPIGLAACNGAAGQRFHLSGVTLMADQSGKCADLFGGASGTAVVLFECNGRDNQRWSSA